MTTALSTRHMGQVIRAWRTHPDHGRAVVSQDQVATWAATTQPRISRIENGAAIQHLDVLIHWATLLAIPPHLLWFSLPAPAPGGDRDVDGVESTEPAIPAPAIGGLLDDVDRRELLRRSAALSGLAVLNPALAAAGLLDQLPPPEIPDRAGRAEIDEIRRAAQSVSDWSFALGGGPALRAGYGHLHWAVELARQACAAKLRPDLHAAVSRLADACGFAAFDNGDHHQARVLFATAHHHAETADNWPLRASALADRALLEIWVDDPDTALTYCDLALVRADRLAPTERAMVWATKARAHAHTGDTQATLTAIGTADDHHHDHSNTDEPAGPLTYYTPAEHAGTCGHALYTLTLTNPTATAPAATEAARRLETAAGGFGDSYARSRAHATIQLATVTMLTGDPDHAATQALTAIDHASPIRSTRTATYLTALHHASAPHADRPLISELRHRTTTLQAAR